MDKTKTTFSIGQYFIQTLSDYFINVRCTNDVMTIVIVWTEDIITIII